MEERAKRIELEAERERLKRLTRYLGDYALITKHQADKLECGVMIQEYFTRLSEIDRELEQLKGTESGTSRN